MNIYVSNLNFRTKSDSLQELFEQYGEVSSANVITDRESGRSRGFGFVEMPNDEDARKAIEALNDTDFDDKRLTVNEARPKTDRDDRGGNRGGGFGRSGGYNRGGGYGRNRY
jgi:RNA recognition motif-containing protein